MISKQRNETNPYILEGAEKMQKNRIGLIYYKSHIKMTNYVVTKPRRKYLQKLLLLLLLLGKS